MEYETAKLQYINVYRIINRTKQALPLRRKFTEQTAKDVYAYFTPTMCTHK